MNIEQIIIALGIAFGVAILQSEKWYDDILMKLKINIKPLNCPLCMAFWLSVIILTIIGIDALLCISASFIVAIISDFVYQKINRIL